MGAVLGEILPFAVAIAVSPLPVIVAVLMLVSDRARAKSFAYVVGRLVGLSVVMALVVVFSGADLSHLGHRDHPTTTSSVIRIIIGALLACYAAWLWTKRTKPGEEPKPGKLLRSVDRVNPGSAVVFGVLLVVLDVSTVVLAVMAGLDIGQTRLPGVEAFALTVAFILAATLTCTVPLLIHLVGGPAFERKLASVKVWLVANEKTVMMVLFLVFAAVLIGRGITHLASA